MTNYTERPASNRPAARLAWDNFIHMRGRPPERMWLRSSLTGVRVWVADYGRDEPEEIAADVITHHLAVTRQGGAA